MLLDPDVTNAVVFTLGKDGRFGDAIDFLAGCNLDVEGDQFVFKGALQALLRYVCYLSFLLHYRMDCIRLI